MLNWLKAYLSQIAAHRGFQRYFFNTSWMFAEQILRIVAGLFVGIYVARYLGPEQFGIYSYALAFVSLLGPVAGLGLNGIVVRDLVNQPDSRDIYLGTAFWLKLAGAILALGLLGVAVQFTGNDATTNLYIFIIASGLIFQSVEVVDFYFQSKVLSKYVSICKLTQLVLSSILKLHFVHIQADLLWFVLVSLIDQVTLAAALAYAYWRQKIGSFLGGFDWTTAKTMLRSSWPLILAGISVSLYMRIDQIMIKEMLGEREVGLYSAAVRISEAWYFVPVIITSSIFPAVLNARKISQVLYKQRLKRLYALMIYTSMAVALVVSIFSESIILMIYGLRYQDAALVLAVHIWAGVFVGLGLINSAWVLAENLQQFSTINTLIGVCTNVILNCFLIQPFGIFGVACATLVSYAVSAYFALILHKKTRPQFYMIMSSLF